MNPAEENPSHLSRQARFVRDSLPKGGLFADQEWRISPAPFRLGEELAKDLDSLGRVLLQFYKATNLLYRQSVAAKQPAWVADWLDRGKPSSLIELQRSNALKNELPRVIRPDILLTEGGFHITELDSVPGGIGLTAWLNETYSELAEREPAGESEKLQIIGGSDGMMRGFSGIFGDAPQVHIVVSEEAASYRPEMEWLAAQIDSNRFHVRDAKHTAFGEGDAVYRFFELFDLPNIPSSTDIFQRAMEKRLRITPPPKPVLEEKMTSALLWNRNLRPFWRQELGDAFLNRLQRHTPYTWVMDPTPLPPQGAIPELNLTDWQQLKQLSQRDRDLILKVSGFSEDAWGARGVYLGSDLSQGDWSAVIDQALGGFDRSPYILQRYHKPRVVDSSWFDFTTEKLVTMPGRVRLCPYYFVHGDNDNARTHLGGVLATICPADKKIIHGMKDAILAPCAV